MKRLAVLLSFCVGFLSLSQEILWIRVISFGQQGRPHAFSLVLAAFLIGIALGAIAGRRICTRSTNVLAAAARVLFVAAAFDLFALYVLSTPLADTLGSPRRLTVILAFIAMTAGLKGILFPIVHHLGSESTAGRVGRSVSRVYLANVMGSTFGPIVTGFWLLDWLPLEVVFALIGTSTAILGLLVIRFMGVRLLSWIAPLVLLCAGVAMLVRPPQVISGIVQASPQGGAVKHLHQNRYGIIHVLPEDSPGAGDTTFGGNAYDGRINVDMKVNSNLLDRAYLMATLHPKPRTALVIGLSTGAWTTVIRGLPDVESIDVVEINPGYLDLIGQYPEIAPILNDERIQIHVADARRWLRQHPDKKYDLIFQNTTWHWRAYVTLLLSEEYFRELSGHLNDGGIAAVNTTSSPDVHYTAMQVFPHVARYKSFTYMSTHPLVKRPDAEDVLRRSTIWGRPAFDGALFAPGAIGASLAGDPVESAEHYIAAGEAMRPPRVISDLNLVPEYRHGAKPPFLWLERILPETVGMH